MFLVLLCFCLHLGLGGTFLVTGWAFADSVLHRLAPLWVGARGLEFTWDYILQGLEANANLVCPFIKSLLFFFLRLKYSPHQYYSPGIWNFF